MSKVFSIILVSLFSFANFAYADAVVGVESWDVLHIRSGPGTKYPSIATIPYDGYGIDRLGDQRRVGRSLWFYVSYHGVTGWVNSRYLRSE